MRFPVVDVMLPGSPAWGKGGDGLYQIFSLIEVEIQSKHSPSALT